TGGLVAHFVIGLLNTARRQVRERFRLPEQTHALQKAIAGAFDTALGAWPINDDESTHYRGLFHDWLLNAAVLSEVCSLLAPDDKSTLNLDLLREKFEDTGLSADHLGTVSFDVLVQDMVGAFYLAAAKEPALQASLQISLLHQDGGTYGGAGTSGTVGAASGRRWRTDSRPVDSDSSLYPTSS